MSVVSNKDMALRVIDHATQENLVVKPSDLALVYAVLYVGDCLAELKEKA